MTEFSKLSIIVNKGGKKKKFYGHIPDKPFDPMSCVRRLPSSIIEGRSTCLISNK